MSGGGEEPGGGFEGWKGVLLAWRMHKEGRKARAVVEGERVGFGPSLEDS